MPVRCGPAYRVAAAAPAAARPVAARQRPQGARARAGTGAVRALRQETQDEAACHFALPSLMNQDHSRGSHTVPGRSPAAPLAGESVVGVAAALVAVQVALQAQGTRPRVLLHHSKAARPLSVRSRTVHLLDRRLLRTALE